MKVFNRFPTQHTDFVHDVAYDFYGKRIATCSSDRTIKIWHKVSQADDADRGGPPADADAARPAGWALQATIPAHTAPVYGLQWAHPVFGQILASCSYDRTVTIWEEQEGALSSGAALGATDPAGQRRTAWKQKAQLVDSREAVNAIAFAPRHLGLKIATASGDGFVRVYEAADVLNLSHWQLQDKFRADEADGSDASPTASWGATCLSWCAHRFDAPMLVVGTGGSTPRIWAHNAAHKRWQPMLELKGHESVVHDASWAPSMGRSFHDIATASKDCTVRVWRVRDGKLEKTWVLGKREAEVWRVEWNVTGTMLASSGDDGRVRLWKQSPKGDWQCCDQIAAAPSAGE
jgi:nucleoporin SEH1